MNEPHIPSDDELRDRVDTVMVPHSNRGKTLHVAQMLRIGGPLTTLCNRPGKYVDKKVGMFPATRWCPECAFYVFNGRFPSNSEQSLMDGDAYE